MPDTSGAGAATVLVPVLVVEVAAAGAFAAVWVVAAAELPAAVFSAWIEALSRDTVVPPAPATTSEWLTRVPHPASTSSAAVATIAMRRSVRRFIGFFLVQGIPHRAPLR